MNLEKWALEHGFNEALPVHLREKEPTCPCCGKAGGFCDECATEIDSQVEAMHQAEAKRTARINALVRIIEEEGLRVDILRKLGRI